MDFNKYPLDIIFDIYTNDILRQHFKESIISKSRKIESKGVTKSIFYDSCILAISQLILNSRIHYSLEQDTEDLEDICISEYNGFRIKFLDLIKIKEQIEEVKYEENILKQQPSKLTTYIRTKFGIDKLDLNLIPDLEYLDIIIPSIIIVNSDFKDKEELLLPLKLKFNNIDSQLVFNQILWIHSVFIRNITSQHYRKLLEVLFNYVSPLFDIDEKKHEWNLWDISEEGEIIFANIQDSSDIQKVEINESMVIKFFNEILIKTDGIKHLMTLQIDKIKGKTQSDVSSQVKDAFKFTLLDDPRKHKQILTPEDHEKLITWVTYYFSNNLKLPKIDESIKKVFTTKGNIITAFKELFDELHPEKTRPNSFYILITKCFYEYRKDNIPNIEKTKKPDGFDDLIKKSK